ncbi:universal stress protein [Geodermatophilus sp. SYSU D00758]
MDDTGTAGRPAGRVVVGVGGSPSCGPALRWAAEQAGLTGSELSAVVAWDLPASYGPPPPDDLAGSGAAAGMLDRTVEAVLGRAGGQRVVRLVVRGHPAAVLADAAGGADLLVVGTRGHGGFAGLVLGSVGQHLVASAACPVAVVREHRGGTGRIVVGVDGSPASGEALRWAAGQARLTGGALHAVLAWHVPVTYGLTVQAEPDQAAHGSRTLAACVAGALDGEDAARVERDVVEGHPAAALLDAAEGADLLVVGRRGRGGFAGLVLGSVSRHVAAHAPCPVVVHPGPSTAPPAR